MILDKNKTWHVASRPTFWMGCVSSPSLPTALTHPHFCRRCRKRRRRPRCPHSATSTPPPPLTPPAPAADLAPLSLHILITAPPAPPLICEVIGCSIPPRPSSPCKICNGRQICRTATDTCRFFLCARTVKKKRQDVIRRPFTEGRRFFSDARH